MFSWMAWTPEVAIFFGAWGGFIASMVVLLLILWRG
jgi:predicted small integral membrane protein